MSRPVFEFLNMAVHDRGGGFVADTMGCLHNIQLLLGIIMSAQMISRTSSSKPLRQCQGALSPTSFSLQILADVHVDVAAPRHTSSGEKRMYVHVWLRRLNLRTILM